MSEIGLDNWRLNWQQNEIGLSSVSTTYKQMLKFNDHVFYVQRNGIKSFKDLKIKATVSTEDVEDAGNKYVKKKTEGTTEVNFVAIFSAMLGNDVKYEALKLIQAAQNAETGYLYLSEGGQVWPFALMITEAEVNESVIGAGGVWSYATVRVTMKQCELNAGGVTPENTDEGGGGNNNNKTTKKIAEGAAKGAGVSAIGIINGGKNATEQGEGKATEDYYNKWTTPAKDTVNTPSGTVNSNSSRIMPRRTIVRKEK